MRKISRVRAERASEWDEAYPTPSQIALRIAAAMLRRLVHCNRGKCLCRRMKGSHASHRAGVKLLSD